MILHVSKNGNDQNSGLSAEQALPDIQTAYDELWKRLQIGQIQESSQILVHEGDYVLSKALHFNKNLPVEIRAFENDKVTISGGAPLTEWKEVEINGHKAKMTVLPDTVKEVPFLYINGKFTTPARFPKQGYLRVQNERFGFVSSAESFDNFQVNDGDFNASWYDPENITIKMIHLWIEETLKFESYNPETKTITTASAMRYEAGKSRSEYAFYNVREALSEENEYYFDRMEHKLYVISSDSKLEAVIPACETLIRFDSGVQWVTLNGLHFRYAGTHYPIFGSTLDLRDSSYAAVSNPAIGSGYGYPKISYSGMQGACHVPGVILFHHASNCAIRNCTVSACSWYGIQVTEACQNLCFSGNDISELGAGGIIIGGGSAGSVKQNPELLTSKIIVTNNHIHGCGLFFYSGIGVLITHACGCLVEDNHIHDLFYSGISCGWVWGFQDSVSRENRIGRNHIHDLGKGILSDMGGVYLLGCQPGTRVYENVIHDIVNRYYGGWGLYTDEGSSHIVLEHNIVYNCACEGFHQHYGRENTVRYNIFAFNKAHGLAVTRNWLNGYAWPGYPHTKAVSFMNNVIITNGTPSYTVSDQTMLDNQLIYADNNIFYDVSGKQKDFACGNTFEQWRKKGLDIHSVQCDPGFRNAEKYDFRLKKDSILKEYGFSFLADLLKK